MRQRPRYSFTAYCTPHNDAFDDISDALRIGANGIGLSELKFETGRDEELREAMAAAGLQATFCVPQSHTLLGMSFGPFKDAQLSLGKRVEMIGASIERLAPFNPIAICVAPGASGDPERPVGPVTDEVHDALGQIADIAAEFEQSIAFELLGRRRGSPIHSIPAMLEVITAVDRPNIGLLIDAFHSWPEPDLHEHLRRHVGRFLGVQVCDVKFHERSGMDREMPGLGRGIATQWVKTLVDAGYDGWWEFEVFSDDGTFGNDFPDSYWKMPHTEFLQLGRAHVDKIFSEMTFVPVSASAGATSENSRTNR
ncbi:sugar phosphate isomerase/epimerase family protein [Rhodococcus globerulus]|uniref:Sugar phosphate isomerase/epimerase family protein n=1 Tax=Rhodococcus globerulus TaxID=33008 RepID=A0ABU4C3D3_RHOGO|nr:sugar phosphate isomerase/epimerase family protein [Rhodococcus globerulus]MDV6271012.1 sugar phosphate isomerase/epimerase family protein [Rhodococcus globerulus]